MHWQRRTLSHAWWIVGLGLIAIGGLLHHIRLCGVRSQRRFETRRPTPPAEAAKVVTRTLHLLRKHERFAQAISDLAELANGDDFWVFASVKGRPAKCEPVELPMVIVGGIAKVCDVVV